MFNKKIAIAAIAYAIGLYITTAMTTSIGPCSPALEELWNEVNEYMKNHPEETASEHEVYNRLLDERYGKRSTLFDMQRRALREIKIRK